MQREREREGEAAVGLSGEAACWAEAKRAGGEVGRGGRGRRGRLGHGGEKENWAGEKDFGPFPFPDLFKHFPIKFSNGILNPFFERGLNPNFEIRFPYNKLYAIDMNATLHIY